MILAKVLTLAPLTFIPGFPFFFRDKDRRSTFFSHSSKLLCALFGDIGEKCYTIIIVSTSN